MATVRIPAPDLESDVSAEQVAGYLLARGWQEQPRPNMPMLAFKRPLFAFTVEVPTHTREGVDTWLVAAIKDVARAEGRHPSDVLADIVGPARGASTGAHCEPWLFVAELRVRLSCKLPAIDLMECSAARGADEGSE